MEEKSNSSAFEAGVMSATQVGARSRPCGTFFAYAEAQAPYWRCSTVVQWP
jgi:hypothetical protein